MVTVICYYPNFGQTRCKHVRAHGRIYDDGDTRACIAGQPLGHLDPSLYCYYL